MLDLEERKQFTDLFPVTPSFRFVVEIKDIPEGAFTQCTLPTIEWEMEQIKEGGMNTGVHQVPGQRKAATIKLQNGIGTVDKLMEWCIAAMNEDFERKNVTVTMYDAQLKPLMTWHLEGALPVRWSAPELKTDSNTAAMQSLELVCDVVTVENRKKGK